MTTLMQALPQQSKPMRADGGACFAAALPMNRCLAIGDLIHSANGMFFAQLAADGRLRVYRGSAPGNDQGVLWDSGRTGEGGRFFALVQTDGNFCIYKGDDLGRNQGWHWGTQLTADGASFHLRLQDDGMLCVCVGDDAQAPLASVWRSGARDPVVGIDRIDAIAYDLHLAKLVQARPADLYRETVNNNDEQIQTSVISGSVTVSDTTAWSDELALTAEVTASFKGAVPIVSGGKVVLSADDAYGYIRNGAATSARNWGFNAPAAVPPHSAMMCLVSAIRSAIVVPYTLSGRFRLESGQQVGGAVRGTYTGANCHDLSVTLTTYDPAPAASYTISRPLTPVPGAAHPVDTTRY